MAGERWEQKKEIKLTAPGFTLVELLIVVLIIGILATIAIPIFNGQRDRARDAVAQSTVRKAMSAARVYWLENQDSYVGLTTADLNDIETTVPATAADPNQAPGGTADPQKVVLFDYQSAPVPSAPTTNGLAVCASSKAKNSFCQRVAMIGSEAGNTQRFTGGAATPAGVWSAGNWQDQW
jgi:prepilin-type N-terminal cleavage/methylation domain-containing protein